MNPMMPLLYAQAFWQDYQTPLELLIVLVVSRVLVKWVVDDFRRSRLSPVTWLLAVLSLLGPIWVATYVASPTVQARLDQFRHHRELILLGSTPHRDEGN